MTDSLLSDEEVHELKLGQSFDCGGAVKYHSMCYDFKPASIDVEQPAVINIESGNKVTVTVPHVKGSSMPHTVYSGSKQPSQKDYALIINHDTGEIVLEKLTYKFNLKRMAAEKPKDMRTLAEKRSAVAAEKHPTLPTTTSRKTNARDNNNVATKPLSNAEHLSGSSSSSEDSDESSSSNGKLSDRPDDSDDDDKKTVAAPVRRTRSSSVGNTGVTPTNASHQTRAGSGGAAGSFNVCEDLQLSESGSDDDE